MGFNAFRDLYRGSFCHYGPYHAYLSGRRHIYDFFYHRVFPGNDHHVSHNVFPDSDYHGAFLDSHDRDDRNRSADPDNQHYADDLSDYYSAANKHRCTNSRGQNKPIDYMPDSDGNADASCQNVVVAHAYIPAIDAPTHDSAFP